MDIFKRYLSDESGATAIEYAMILGVLSVSLVVGGKAFAEALNSRFNSVSEELANTDLASE